MSHRDREQERAFAVLSRNIPKITSPLKSVIISYHDVNGQRRWHHDTLNFSRGVSKADLSQWMEYIQREYRRRVITEVKVIISASESVNFDNGRLYHRGRIVPVAERPMYSQTPKWRRLEALYESHSPWVYVDEIADSEMIDVAFIHPEAAPTNSYRPIVMIHSSVLMTLLRLQYGIRGKLVEAGTSPHLSPSMMSLLPPLSATKDGLIQTKKRKRGMRDVSIGPQTHEVFGGMNAALKQLNELPLTEQQKADSGPRAASTAWLNLYGQPRPADLLRQGVGRRGWARLPNAKRALNALGIPSNHIRVDEWASEHGNAYPTEFEGSVTMPDSGEVLRQAGTSRPGYAFLSPPSWRPGFGPTNIVRMRMPS